MSKYDFHCSYSEDDFGFREAMEAVDRSIIVTLTTRKHHSNPFVKFSSGFAIAAFIADGQAFAVQPDLYIGSPEVQE